MKSKGWLPEGTTQGDLDDGDFAWLSDAYKAGDESKSKGRKLPYKIHSVVNEDGWKSAWSRAHQMDDEDFDGGPSRSQVYAKLLKDKPDDVEVEDDEKSGRPYLMKDGRKLELKTFRFKADPPTVEDGGLQSGEFSGYGACFGNVDSYGDIIQKGAFANTLDHYLERGTICWQHEWWNPIGKPLEVSEDDKGLLIKARISQTTLGQDALILLRDGVVQELSIGFIANGWKVLTDEEGEVLLGKDGYAKALRDLPWWSDGIRLLTDITLYEVSPVTVAANDQALITGVKNGLPAGLKLDAQYETVLAAVSELTGRFKSVYDLRVKSGRKLSNANVAKLTTMKTSLSDHVDTITDMIAANTTDEGGNDYDDESFGAGNQLGADASDVEGKEKSPPKDIEPSEADAEPEDVTPTPEEEEEVREGEELPHDDDQDSDDLTKAAALAEYKRLVAFQARENGVAIPQGEAA